MTNLSINSEKCPSVPSYTGVPVTSVPSSVRRYTYVHYWIKLLQIRILQKTISKII